MPPGCSSSVNHSIGGLQWPSVDDPSIQFLARRALTLLDQPNVQVRATVQRADAAAVLLEDRSRRWFVISERSDGDWTLPSLVLGGRLPPIAARAVTTDASEPLRQSSSAQAGPVAAHSTQPPQTGWWATAGIAARDVRRAIAASTIDEHSCPVGPDGLVLLLVRSAWRESPVITLRTDRGQVVDHSR